VRDGLDSFVDWTRAVSKWWWGAISVLLTGEALVLFIGQSRHFILWVMIAALEIALMGSFVAYRNLRSRTALLAATSAAHLPPGGGAPAIPPVDYQVAALRQIVAKISETMTEVGFSTLQAVLLNHPRSGTDPVYEPLSPFSCRDGLDRLTELGELKQVDDWRWIIVTPNPIPTGHQPAHARARRSRRGSAGSARR
jgi:hypothetical protein